MFLARHWWLMPVVLATREAEIQRIAVQASLGKKQDSDLKRRAKWIRGVAQVAEHLLCKRQALSHCCKAAPCFTPLFSN
jgi:hypothetical protein